MPLRGRFSGRRWRRGGRGRWGVPTVPRVTARWALDHRGPVRFPWALPVAFGLAPSGAGRRLRRALAMVLRAVTARWALDHRGPVRFPWALPVAFEFGPFGAGRRLRRALAMVLRAVTAHWALDHRGPDRFPWALPRAFEFGPFGAGEAPAAGTRDGSACGYGPLGLGPSWTGPFPLGVAQGFRVWPLRGGFRAAAVVLIGPSAAAAGF